MEEDPTTYENKKKLIEFIENGNNMLQNAVFSKIRDGNVPYTHLDKITVSCAIDDVPDDILKEMEILVKITTESENRQITAFDNCDNKID